MADLSEHVGEPTPERLARWRKTELAEQVLKLRIDNMALRAELAEAHARLAIIRETIGRSFA